MPKFFVNNENIIKNKIIIKKDYNHIKNVLRKQIGDNIQICNEDDSKTYNCKISNIREDTIECDIKNEILTNTESSLKVTIFQGLPKSEKMETVIQKSIELGIYEITPVEMKNSVVKLNEKDKQKKIQRWQKIAEVAAKQCGRNIIPKINNICSIEDICEKIDSYNSVIVAYENEENYSIKDEIEKLKRQNNKVKDIAVVIGPEGGFDIKEIDNLKKAGANIVTLGKRILRTETVSIAITSILMYELGDFN